MDNYEILINENIFKNIDLYFQKVSKNKDIFIITDENVYDIYKKDLVKYAPSFNLIFIKVKQGEQSKSFKTYEEVIEQLIEKGFKKHHLLVSFGGGVVGDLTGFIASTLYRGVSYIQIPTTVLSMVDSSIGMKTAINSKSYKNMIGTFYPPKQVLIDLTFLNSLSKREYNNGIAEIIKIGLILNKELYEMIKENKIVDEKIIKEAILMKKYVVEKDPLENEFRKVLNFGHTYGHLIEKTNNYSLYKHGEAISYGMLIAIKKGIDLKITDPKIYDEVFQTLKSFNLIDKYIEPNKYDGDIYFDKKHTSSGISFIVLEKIGKVKIIELEK